MTTQQASGLQAALEALHGPPADDQLRAEAIALIDAQRKRDYGEDDRDLFRRAQVARNSGC